MNQGEALLAKMEPIIEPSRFPGVVAVTEWLIAVALLLFLALLVRLLSRRSRKQLVPPNWQQSLCEVLRRMEHSPTPSKQDCDTLVRLLGLTVKAKALSLSKDELDQLRSYKDQLSSLRFQPEIHPDQLRALLRPIQNLITKESPR